MGILYPKEQAFYFIKNTKLYYSSWSKSKKVKTKAKNKF